MPHHGHHGGHRRGGGGRFWGWGPGWDEGLDLGPVVQIDEPVLLQAQAPEVNELGVDIQADGFGPDDSNKTETSGLGSQITTEALDKAFPTVAVLTGAMVLTAAWLLGGRAARGG